MTDKLHTCGFCGNSTDNFIKVRTPKYYRGHWEETIPFCNLGCVRTILVSAGDCDNRAVEQAIKVVKSLNKVDPEIEAAEEYRKELLKDAAKCVAMIEEGGTTC